VTAAVHEVDYATVGRYTTILVGLVRNHVADAPANGNCPISISSSSVNLRATPIPKGMPTTSFPLFPSV
jgi:hypothetical protein